MDEGEEELDKGFHVEFAFKGSKYLAHIKFPWPLNEEEKQLFKIEDGEFLVHLFDGVGSKTFKVFIGNEFEQAEYGWLTDAPSILIDPEIVPIIGKLIDSKLA